MNKEYVNWCLKQAELALADYDMPTAKDYIALARYWNKRSV